jgi:putative transposase
VIPGLPHHVTQRGNRRQQTFFAREDYERYLRLMARACASCGVEIWAWCLMPNHVHLVAVPPTEDALRQAIGDAHQRYTLHVNQREEWQGHLWQGRFASYVMDERYLRAAVRYVELNPVRAGLTAFAEQYPWSSARAHVEGRDDVLVQVAPMLERVPDWRAFLGEAADAAVEIRLHQSSGRPLGSDDFVEEIERRLGRDLKTRPRGRPRAEA